MRRICAFILTVCLFCAVTAGSAAAGTVLPGPLSGDSIWLNETVTNDYWVAESCSLAFNPVTGYPGIAYFCNWDLNYAWYDGSVWQIDTVDNSGYVGKNPSLAFNATGYPAITHYDSMAETVKYAWYDGTSWHSETVVSAGNQYCCSSLAFNTTSDLPAFSYNIFSSYDLMYAWYDGTSWHNETVVSAGDVANYNSLAFNSTTGQPAISYDDWTSYSLEKLMYAWYDGSTWHTDIADSSSSSIGGGNSLAFNSTTGHPAISYGSYLSDASVKYAWFDGSVWQNITVDSGLHNYGYPTTSLAFSNAGFAAISYYNATGTSLKYAWNSPSGWQTECVDNDGMVGSWNSLAFNTTSGMPAICYQNKTTDISYWYGLKYAWKVPAGGLDINSTPDGAWVYADGVNLTAQTNSSFTATVGTFNITVIKPRHLPGINTSVPVLQGLTTPVFFELILVPLVANFTASPSAGPADLLVQFNDTSEGWPEGWNWTFGDGATSTQQDPVHLYTVADNYTVVLNVTAGGQYNETSRFVDVDMNTSFTAAPDSGPAVLDVLFNDTTLGAPDSWEWDFGDGSTADTQNATHSYPAAGLYTVSLNATNSTTGKWNVSTRDIEVLMNTNFTATPLAGTAPLMVEFTDTTLGMPTMWNWSFGDGAWFNTTNPAERNATHEYVDGGLFTVSLTASNGTFADTETKADYIDVAMAAFFSGWPRSGFEPLYVEFTDESLGTPVSWTWDFGDGSTSTHQNYWHTYAAGTYTVTLTVESAFGASNTVTFTDYVTVYPVDWGTSGGGSSAGGQTDFTGSGSIRSNSGGETLMETIIRASDGVATLTIPAGTQALDKNGNPVGDIGIVPLAGIPEEPKGLFSFAGYAWQCTPAGATFDPPITLTLTFTPEQWAELDPASMVLEWYNPATGLWETLPAVIDPVSHTVTASISHFSVFALFEAAEEVVVIAEEEAVVVVEEVPTTAAPETTAPPTTQSPLVFAPVLGLAAIPFLLRKR